MLCDPIDEEAAMTDEQEDDPQPERDPGDPGPLKTKGEENAAGPDTKQKDSGDPGQIGTRDLEEGRKDRDD
jgi:hypothetical protein